MMKDKKIFALISILALAMIAGSVRASTVSVPILEDVTIENNSATFYEPLTGLMVQTSNSEWFLQFIVKANVTGLNSSFENATFCGFTYEVYNGGLEEILVHHVTNQTWDADSMNGLDNPILMGQYNLTAEYNTSTVGLGTEEWKCFDITNGMKSDIDALNENSSFLVIPMPQDASVNDTYMYDSEDMSNPAYIELYYPDPVTTTTTTTVTTTTSTTSTSTTTTIPLETAGSVLSDIGYGLGSLFTNISGPLVGFVIVLAIGAMVGVIISGIGKGVGRKV